MISASRRHNWRPLARLGAAAICVLASLAAVTADGGAYRLGVDDVVTIRVLYQPEFSVENAIVRPDGRINVPVVGEVEVAGRTIAEVAESITEALRRELRDPRVSVQLVRRHVEPVYVVGAVRSPGAVNVREPVTVAEAIALAGGLTTAAAPRFGVIIGADGSQRRIDVPSALSGAASPTRIAPGETLVVSAQFLVSVVGRVASPGRYPCEAGDRVADALAAAGGLAPGAAEAGSLVRADGTQIELDLASIVEHGVAADNPALEAGDLIVVPEVTRRVTVVGAFDTPGRYDFDEGARVSDAIALAHGVSDDARLTAAVLVRRDGSSQTVDLEALLQGEADNDPALADGDTLILPCEVDRVAVLGSVVHPGLYALEAGMTLMDALAAAGGWSQNDSRPTETILWRRTAGEPQMTFINAQEMLRGAAEGENPPLQAGDIVFVPSRKEITRDQAVRTLLGITGVLHLLF